MYTMILIVIGLTSTPGTPPNIAVTSFPVKDGVVCEDWRKKLEAGSTSRIRVEAHCVPGSGR